jgi:diguanylate cyclase (GGDEF)-like protein
VLERILTRLGHEIVVVESGSEALAALLADDAPRLAILDWMMPGKDGLSVCRAVRQRPGPYVYLILLTSRDRLEDMLAGLDAGADDFLTKPCHHTELEARLRSGLRVLELQEGLLQVQEALRIQATRDHLTGCWNRRMILDQLGRELHRAAHERRPLAIALADLDHFKAVNDAHGHAAGDQVLREASLRIRAAVREYDFIGRYGGEEFLVLLPGCDAHSGSEAAERIRAAIAATPVLLGSASLPISVSLGLAWTSVGNVDAGALVRQADHALYGAKAKGRNRVEVAGAGAA